MARLKITAYILGVPHLCLHYLVTAGSLQICSQSWRHNAVIMSPINLNRSFYGFRFRVNVNGRHGRNEQTDTSSPYSIIQVQLPPAGVMIWIRSNQM